MSDLIKKLADQARMMVPEGLVVDEWVAAYNNEFAKLIAKQCLSYMEEGDIDFAQWMIKKQFGLEALTKQEQFMKDVEAVFKDGADLSGKETP